MAQVHTVTVRTSVAVAQPQVPAVAVKVPAQITRVLKAYVQTNRTAEPGQRKALEILRYHGEKGVTVNRRILPLWLFEFAGQDGAKVLRVKAWDFDAVRIVRDADGTHQERGDWREFRLDRIEGLSPSKHEDNAPYAPGMKVNAGGYFVMTIFPVHPSNAWREAMTVRQDKGEELIATGYWDWQPAAEPIPYVTIMRGTNG